MSKTVLVIDTDAVSLEVDGLLLDCDGVLVDSHSASAIAWNLSERSGGCRASISTAMSSTDGGSPTSLPN